MSMENRKAVRRVIRHPAVILNPDGSIFFPCTMFDVSATGAKLVLQEPAQVPAEFLVLLSKYANVHRVCKTSRQSGTSVGVQFVFENPKEAATLGGSRNR
jgi:hypothetical protein